MTRKAILLLIFVAMLGGVLFAGKSTPTPGEPIKKAAKAPKKKHTAKAPKKKHIAETLKKKHATKAPEKKDIAKSFKKKRQKRRMDMLKNPVACQLLAIGKIKALSIKTRTPHAGAALLLDAANWSQNPWVKRAAIFAASEVFEQAGMYTEAAETLSHMFRIRPNKTKPRDARDARSGQYAPRHKDPDFGGKHPAKMKKMKKEKMLRAHKAEAMSHKFRIRPHDKSNPWDARDARPGQYAPRYMDPDFGGKHPAKMEKMKKRKMLSAHKADFVRAWLKEHPKKAQQITAGLIREGVLQHPPYPYPRTGRPPWGSPGDTRGMERRNKNIRPAKQNPKTLPMPCGRCRRQIPPPAPRQHGSFQWDQDMKALHQR